MFPVEAELQLAMNISRGSLQLLALLAGSQQVPSLCLSPSSWSEEELETNPLFSNRSALLVVLHDFLLLHKFIWKALDSCLEVSGSATAL